MNESKQGVVKQHTVLLMYNFYNIIHISNFLTSSRSICKTLDTSVTTGQLAMHVEY